MTVVSVALCTYNGERYLPSQLESILTQTRLPDEIVIADDGSTDRTPAILEDFAAGSRVPVRLLPGGARRGVAANFERAATATSGDLIVLSDQDDVWHPRRVEIAVESFVRDPELVLLHGDAVLVDEGGEPLGSTLFDALRVRPAERRAVEEGHAFDVYLRRNLVTGATAVIKRRLLDVSRPFPPGWVHDEWLALVASVTGNVAMLPDPVIDYRQHQSNEIGVALPTVRRLLSRVVADRGDRHERLAHRWRLAAERWAVSGFPIAPGERVAAKASFEERRTAYPRRRLARLPGILGHLARGDYRRYASQGSLDALRDLAARATT